MKLQNILIFILAITIYACSPEDYLNLPDTQIISFESSAGSSAIVLSTNQDWTIWPSSDWITVSPSKGKAGNNIRIELTASANPTYDTRTAELLFSAGSAARIINVIQDERKGFVVADKEFSIGSKGGDLKIPINANVNYSCTIAEDCKDWISLVRTKSVSNYHILLSIAKNNTFDKRTGTVEISAGDIKTTVSISQSQKPELDIPVQSFEIGRAGGEIRIPVRSSIEYSVELMNSASGWITLQTDQTKSLTENFIYVKVDENKEYDARSGQIKVSGEDKESIITITQSQLNELIVNYTTFNIDQEGGIMYIPFQTNCDFGYEIIGDAHHWLSITQAPETKGLADYSITMKIKPNPTYDNRVGQIRIYTAEKESIVTVNQKQTDGMKVHKNHYDIPANETTFSIEFDTNIDVYCFVDSSSPWLKIIDTKALETNRVTLYAKQNGLRNDRTATVYLVSGEFREEITVTQGYDTSFNILTMADDNAQSACIRNFDTDGDGLLSYAEAAAVKVLPSDFLVGSERQIASFDELQFFTSLETISSHCFENTNLQSVFIPGGEIGDSAFRGCSNLHVEMTDKVTSIGDSAFRNCAWMNEIDIKGAKSIGNFAFSDCIMLTDVRLPEVLTSIGAQAFRHCVKLQHINIPQTVRSIGLYAFGECYMLEGEFSIPKGVTTIEPYAFYNCRKITRITLPDDLLSIEDSAFYVCSSLESINIPETVTYIGPAAFGGCPNLTGQIKIPDGITKIEDLAFSGCSSISNFLLPGGITSIGSGAFSGCALLTEFKIPDNVQSIGNDAFSGCSNLTSISIPHGVTIINAKTFNGCSNLKEIDIPATISTIKEYAFSGCSGLVDITIPDGVLSIGEGVFNYCTSLERITLPASVKSIGMMAFQGCSSLKHINIPENVKKIESDTFAYCSSLQEIVIPANVYSIGGLVFRMCTSLKTLHVKANTPPNINHMGLGASALEVVYVPEASLEKYKNSDWGLYYGSILKAENS